MLKVGYLGPEGTFSQEAGALYAKKLKHVDLIPYSTIYDLMMAVDRRKVDEGITPIENSIEGTIGIVTDMLVKDVKLMIRGELVIPIYEYLMARKGVKLSEITDIISHPQPIDQCKGYLRKTLPHVTIHLSSSTSEAARQVATYLSGAYAAIGAKASARLYGLNILAEKINDYKDNLTRFIVVSKCDHRKTGSDKTSFVFSVSRDKPGGLYNILGEFAGENINLTKIESRPSKRALGDYFFFIDFQGHRSDKKIADMLSRVKKKVAFFKLLGSYPKARI